MKLLKSILGALIVFAMVSGLLLLLRLAFINPEYGFPLTILFIFCMLTAQICTEME